MSLSSKEYRVDLAKSKKKTKKLSQILQSRHKGFAYQLLQLEMILEDDAPAIGRNKLDDISKLIELYMKGVQALECCSDPRSKYFSGKLNALMLKKTVFEELHKGTDPKQFNDYLSSQHKKEEKIEKHQIRLMYTTESVQQAKKKELFEAEKVLVGCENIVRNGIINQQNSIKERIKQRKLRSQNGSLKKGDKPIKRDSYAHQQRINDYFGGQQQRTIGQGQRKRINFVTINSYYDRLRTHG